VRRRRSSSESRTRQSPVRRGTRPGKRVPAKAEGRYAPEPEGMPVFVAGHIKNQGDCHITKATYGRMARRGLNEGVRLTHHTGNHGEKCDGNATAEPRQQIGYAAHDARSCWWRQRILTDGLVGRWPAWAVCVLECRCHEANLAIVVLFFSAHRVVCYGVCNVIPAFKLER